MRHFDLSLYLVLDPESCTEHGLLETARAAVAGGATMIQLRAKRAKTAQMVEMGRTLRQALVGSDIPLLINDDIEAAIAIGAEGVHIGQEDELPAAARALIGREMILGLSVESTTLAEAGDPAIIDYIGAGPVFATHSKADHKPPIGFDGLAKIVACSKVPVVAIGGLRAQHAEAVLGAGAEGLAVISAICSSADPQSAAVEIYTAIKKARS